MSGRIFIQIWYALCYPELCLMILYFTQLSWILCVMYSSLSLSLHKMDSRHLNQATPGMMWNPIFTCKTLLTCILLKLHSIYPAILLLNKKKKLQSFSPQFKFRIYSSWLTNYIIWQLQKVCFEALALGCA